MEAGMYPRAVSLLEKRINEKPSDAEAHFQLGTSYIHTEQYTAAREIFDRAVAFGSDYGYRSGLVCQNNGSNLLSSGNVKIAQYLFTLAVKYHPDFKKPIAGECLNYGRQYLENNQSEIANKLFAMAVGLDPGLNEAKNTITKPYGEKLLESAKSKPKNDRKPYIDEARKYLPQKDIDSVLPPPEWKVVWKKQYTGLGFKEGGADGKGGIPTAKTGIHTEYGDKITVIDTDFEIWENAKWQSYKKGHEVHNKSRSKNAPVGFRVQKGKKFTVLIKRFSTSY